MKKNILFLCIMGLQFAAYGSSPYLISFFIKPLTIPLGTEKQPLRSPKSRGLVSQPFGAHLVHTGIFVSYAGVSTSSDQNGQILLPRKTANPELHIFITEKISFLPLTPSKQKTILGFTTRAHAPLQHLLYKREKDIEADSYVWNVIESKWPPYKKIPWDAIIIFADPLTMISPLGKTTTPLNENFILPDFYITSTAKTALDALRFLTLKSFVAPLSFTYSFHPQDIQKMLKP